MKKCSKCGAEMIDEAVFCGNCGARIEAEAGTSPASERYTQEEIVDNSQSEAVFCPNCGKKLTPEDVFCDECGYQLNGSNQTGSVGGDGSGKKKFKLPKAVIPVAAAVAVVAVAVGVGSMLFSGGSGGKGDVSSKVLYIKDGAMMNLDTSKKKAEPVTLTTSYTKKDQYVRTGLSGNSSNYISENGKYICYVEDRTEESYDLYRAKMSKPSEGTKIDSKVSGHRLLKDGTVMYKKKDTLYWYNGKESISFGKNVDYYRLDESQKYVCWSEIDKGDNVYYVQDLAQKSDKVRLGKEVDSFFCKDDFSVFYLLQDDKLNVVTKEGDKTKKNIAKDVEYIFSFDSKNGRFYYYKDTEEQEIPYEDLVSEASGDNISDWDRERLADETYTFGTSKLCFYDGKAETVISEQMTGDPIYSLSDKDAFILYAEVPDIKDLSVAWSDMENLGWWWAVNEVLVEELTFRIAREGTNTGAIELEDDMIPKDDMYSSDDGKLYIYMTDEDGEDGIIYVTDTKGSNAGKLEEYATDLEDVQLLMANKSGLYYLKDYDYEGGDLYLGNEMILDDVASVTRVGDTEKVAIRHDFDGEDLTSTVDLWDGKKNTQVSEDVNGMECADNGTAVFLVEYNYNRKEGNLMYFDGKEARVLDQDVTSFFTRKGSNTIVSY